MNNETDTPPADFVCPECGELIRIKKGEIVFDGCRCGLPGNRPENKKE